MAAGGSKIPIRLDRTKGSLRADVYERWYEKGHPSRNLQAKDIMVATHGKGPMGVGEMGRAVLGDVGIVFGLAGLIGLVRCQGSVVSSVVGLWCSIQSGMTKDITQRQGEAAACCETTR